MLIYTCVILITMSCAVWTWEGLTTQCKNVHQKYGPDIEIPTELDPDVLQVFDDTRVHENIFRFVTYILWLEHQPDAFDKYLEVKVNRPKLWADCLYKLCLL